MFTLIIIIFGKLVELSYNFYCFYVRKFMIVCRKIRIME